MGSSFIIEKLTIPYNSYIMFWYLTIFRSYIPYFQMAELGVINIS